MNRTLYEVNEVLKKNGGPIPMSKAGIYKAIADGKIPAQRVGRRIFIPSYYIEKLISDPAK